MKTQKKVGIWMDHLNANLIDVEATDRIVPLHQNLL
jgi:hypothetical protein